MFFTASDVPQRAPGLPWQEIDGNVLLLQPAERFAHELNGLASFVWKAIDGKNSAAQIISEVLEQFDVEESVATTDVLSFLGDLKEKQLIL